MYTYIISHNEYKYCVLHSGSHTIKLKVNQIDKIKVKIYILCLVNFKTNTFLYTKYLISKKENNKFIILHNVIQLSCI